MIKAFLGATTVLLVGAGVAGGPGKSVRSVVFRSSASIPLPTSAEGTNSTPGAFALPLLGSVSFRCRPDWSVQPVFDLRGASATEEVTIRAGGVLRRRFTHSPGAQEVALPFGHYGIVRFTVHQITEAREIEAAVTADFIAGTFAERAASGRVGACYVRRWSVRMDVRPY